MSSDNYESRDWHLKPVLLTLMTLAALVVVTFIGCRWLLSAEVGMIEESYEKAHPLATTPQLPPNPRLERFPGKLLENYRVQEKKQLTNYGWINQEAGVVRLPIERAMELVVKDGLPVKEPVQ